MSVVVVCLCLCALDHNKVKDKKPELKMEESLTFANEKYFLANNSALHVCVSVFRKLTLLLRKKNAWHTAHQKNWGKRSV